MVLPKAHIRVMQTEETCDSVGSQFLHCDQIKVNGFNILDWSRIVWNCSWGPREKGVPLVHLKMDMLLSVIMCFEVPT